MEEFCIFSSSSTGGPMKDGGEGTEIEGFSFSGRTTAGLGAMNGTSSS